MLGDTMWQVTKLSPAPFGATAVGRGTGDGPHGWGSTMTGGRGGNQRPTALGKHTPLTVSPHLWSLGKDFPVLLVLHLLQDRHNHVKLGPLSRVFIHADLHELTHMGGNAWWDGRPKAFQCHL